MGADSIRLRASLLSHFEVPWLGEIHNEDSVDRLLLEDCSRISVSDGTRHWAMDDAARRSVIAEATRGDLLDALGQVTRRPDDPQQWAIETLVAGDALQHLQDADLEHLRALASVARWLDGGFGQSVAQTITNRLRLTELLESLRAVASPYFLGRNAELFELAQGMFVGGPPVLVRGLGGIGKSALVARYVIGAVETLGARFAYLNFDDVSLDPRYPASLLLAVLRHLALQLDTPGSAGLERLMQRARDRIRTGSRGLEVQSRLLQVKGPSPGTHGGDIDDLLIRAAEFIHPGGPLIIVLDTLEDVQRRDSSAMLALTSFLQSLMRAMPAQLVLAGRAPIPELRAVSNTDPVEIVLDGLAPTDAVHLLGLLYDRGDVDLDEVVSKVGTSPLCIRLAAEILRRAPADEALRGLELRRVGAEGELYRRLLGHIPDLDVRRLAHPGLTLRRVTPELIMNVLADPCDVAVPDLSRARRLFDGLAGEAVLVERDPTDPWTLIHRADIRRMMLARLANDEPDRVRRIHLGAVRYHGARSDLVARTEELYHRLMLGESEHILDQRWDQRALAGLSGSIDELPAVSRAYLASKDANLAVSDEDLHEAEVQTRRRIVEQRVQELISEGLVARAADVLRSHVSETADRSASITDLRIQVLELLGCFSEALDVATQARAECGQTGSVQDFVGLSLHYARLAERTGQMASGERCLSEALEFTRSRERTPAQELLELRLTCALLGLRRRGGAAFDHELAARAIDLYDALGVSEVRTVPGLLRDLAAEVGKLSPAIVNAALRAVGVGPEAGEAVVAEHAEPAVAAWSADIERGEAGASISGLLDESDAAASAEISEAVAEIYQSESDAAIEYAPDEGGFEGEAGGAT